MRKKRTRKAGEKKLRRHTTWRLRLRRIAASAAILMILGAGGLGFWAVDRNTRRTGLSHAPGLVEMEKIAPREYLLELLGGQYSLTFRLPGWM